MKQTHFTTIVLQHPNGRREVITRRGHHDVHVVARTFETMTGGKVQAIRHEQSSEQGERRNSVTIRRMT